MATIIAEAAEAEWDKEEDGAGETRKPTNLETVFSSYLGIGFAIFLFLLPKSVVSLLPTLQSRNRYLLLRLHQAEEQLSQLKSRRQEDSKANARVVEIFASYRNTWLQEERRLLQQIESSNEEIARLRAKVAELERSETNLLSELEELKREIDERDELLNFMSRKTASLGGFDEVGGDRIAFASASGVYRNGSVKVRVMDESDYFGEKEGDGDPTLIYGHDNVFDPDLFSPSSKFWADQPNLWQDVHYESHQPMCQMKHFVTRRESPWRVKGESTGVSSKLKLLEKELLNLERIGESDLLKLPSLMRKQARRYQALAGKIDDLCRRMQASDPCESAQSSGLQTQRQTEFLLEALQLQQRASEAGPKLMALQTEINNSCVCDEMGSQTKLITRRSVDAIKNNLKEIQRNLEILLARIIGDLEGILARDGASRVREYYFSRYRYV
ncbi:hypothetical protein Nepgr_028638 [Nepenthes gracilis]|uniref:Uncharacterized protein n=1 Tax=Nepenthes gracilis TaxID=150966 RepID=A0AAD3TAQ3_NEPGR|nr:hypothetical protein Nepgr_028638 [Nepenthes gracilis]